MLSGSLLLLLTSASLALSTPLALSPRTDATNIKCTDANAYVFVFLFTIVFWSFHPWIGEPSSCT